jgi:hypothetical protein
MQVCVLTAVLGFRGSCPSVHCVRRIAPKPTPLDFSDHVPSSNVIECVKNIPKIFFLAYNRKIVSNEAIILKFS